MTKNERFFALFHSFFHKNRVLSSRTATQNSDHFHNFHKMYLCLRNDMLDADRERQGHFSLHVTTKMVETT